MMKLTYGRVATVVAEKIEGVMNDILYIFDLDGTLTRPFQDTLYPHMAAWFESAQPQQVAIATNQGDVGLRWWLENRGFKEDESLPTRAMVETRLGRVAEQIEELTEGSVSVYVAFRYQTKSGNWLPAPDEADPRWSKEWRKPSPGMLLQAKFDFGQSEAVFVGDRPTDRQAAEMAFVPFIPALDFLDRVVGEGTI